MNNLLLVASVTALTIALPLAPAPSPARAAEPTIEVSGDGTVYSQEFDGLFNGTILVPRATDSDTFIIRNSSDRDVYLRMVVTNVRGSSPLYLQSLELNVDGPGWMSEPMLLSAATPCREVVTGVPLQQGEQVTIGADVTLADLVGTEGQQESARFSLQIVATEQVQRPGQAACAAAPPGSPPRPPTSPPATPPTVVPPEVPSTPASPPLLGVTGGQAPLALLLTGAIAIGMGVNLLARRRKTHRRGQQ